MEIGCGENRDNCRHRRILVLQAATAMNQKGERIHTPKSCRGGSDQRPHAIGKHVKSQSSTFVSLTRSHLYLGEVSRHTGNPQQTRGMVQCAGQFLRGQRSLPLKMEQNARVNRASPGFHHQALQRSEDGSSGDAKPTAHGGCRAATSQLKSAPSALSASISQLRPSTNAFPSNGPSENAQQMRASRRMRTRDGDSSPGKRIVPRRNKKTWKIQ